MLFSGVKTESTRTEHALLWPLRLQGGVGLKFALVGIYDWICMPVSFIAEFPWLIRILGSYSIVLSSVVSYDARASNHF
jgi:hypothetical protein